MEAFNSLAELAGKAANNPAEMWKRLKALSEQKPSNVLLEIVCDDGTISSDKKEVLLKWYSDFSQCFRESRMTQTWSLTISIKIKSLN